MNFLWLKHKKEWRIQIEINLWRYQASRFIDKVLGKLAERWTAEQNIGKGKSETPLKYISIYTAWVWKVYAPRVRLVGLTPKLCNGNWNILGTFTKQNNTVKMFGLKIKFNIFKLLYILYRSKDAVFYCAYLYSCRGFILLDLVDDERLILIFMQCYPFSMRLLNSIGLKI